MKSRLWIILAFLGCVGALGMVGAYRAREVRQEVKLPVIKPAVVRCAPLEVTPFSRVETFYGRIAARAEVAMAFQIAGRVKRLADLGGETWKEGDVIRKGQVVAQLDPEFFEAELGEAQAQMEQAKAAIALAEADLAEARAIHADAKRELERIEGLRAQNAAPQREVDKAQLAVERAQASMDGAQARLSAAAASYNAARSSEQKAQVSLTYTDLLAPMDGLVAAVPAEIGQMVRPGDPVMRIVDIGSVKVALGVVQSKLPLLKVGQRVEVEVRALAADGGRGFSDEVDPRSLREGVVAVVPPAADATTNVFNVEVVLNNDDGALLPGMIGRAKVEVENTRAIRVPVEAVVRTGNRYWAFFVTHGAQVGLDMGSLGSVKIDVPTTIARRVPFDPQFVGKDYYLLADAPLGLDQLIVEGQTRLEDGQPVKIVAPLGAGSRTAAVE